MRWASRSNSVAVNVTSCPATGGSAPGLVGAYVANFQGRLVTWHAFGAAQHGAHARHQLPWGERLRDVIIAAHLQPQDSIDLFVTRRDEDHRGPIALGAQPTADLGAVDLRHADVEHDDDRPQ